MTVLLGVSPAPASDEIGTLVLEQSLPMVSLAFQPFGLSSVLRHCQKVFKRTGSGSGRSVWICHAWRRHINEKEGYSFVLLRFVGPDKRKTFVSPLPTGCPVF